MIRLTLEVTLSRPTTCSLPGSVGRSMGDGTSLLQVGLYPPIPLNTFVIFSIVSLLMACVGGRQLSLNLIHFQR